MNTAPTASKSRNASPNWKNNFPTTRRKPAAEIQRKDAEAQSYFSAPGKAFKFDEVRTCIWRMAI